MLNLKTKFDIKIHIIFFLMVFILILKGEMYEK